MTNTFQQSKIIQKPWGQEEIWAECPSYLGKIITVKPGCRLSRQYHCLKEETVRVLSGRLLLEVGDKDSIISKNLEIGDSFHVKPGTIHRFCCDGNEDLILLEVSTYHPDDVIRLNDDYNR